MSIVQCAKHFAVGAHEALAQKRKWTDEPYFVHPIRVGFKLHELGCDDEVVAAGFLHDVVEDTKVELEVIRGLFGDRIAQYVNEVTNIDKPEDGNRMIRANINRQHLSKASTGGKTIKLVDINDNMDTIITHGGDFTRVWMNEKKLTMPFLIGGDPTMWSLVDDRIRSYFNETEGKKL